MRRPHLRKTEIPLENRHTHTHTSSSSSDSSSDSSETSVQVRRSGRERAQTTQYDPATGQTIPDREFSVLVASAARNYINTLAEIDIEELHLTVVTANLYLERSAVGAGFGGGFSNTNEFKVMQYNQAINGPDAETRKVEIVIEHSRIMKNKVFIVVPKCDLPPNTRLIGST